MKPFYQILYALRFKHNWINARADQQTCETLFNVLLTRKHQCVYIHTTKTSDCCSSVAYWNSDQCFSDDRSIETDWRFSSKTWKKKYQYENMKLLGESNYFKMLKTLQNTFKPKWPHNEYEQHQDICEFKLITQQNSSHLIFVQPSYQVLLFWNNDGVFPDCKIFLKPVFYRLIT